MSREVLAIPWDRMVGLIREHSKTIWDHRRAMLILWMKRAGAAMIFCSFWGLVPSYPDVWVMLLLFVTALLFSFFLDKDRGWTMIGVVAGVFLAVTFAAPILQPIKYYVGSILVALGKAGMNGSGGLKVGWFFAGVVALGGVIGIGAQKVYIGWWCWRRYQEGILLCSEGETATAAQRDVIAEFWHELATSSMLDMANVLGFHSHERIAQYVRGMWEFKRTAYRRVISDRYRERHKNLRAV